MMRADRPIDRDDDEQLFLQKEDGRRLSAVEVRGCPRPALLNAAAAGALPAELAAVIQTHVEACVICRQLTADLQEIEPGIDMLEEARVRRRIDRARRRPLWRVAALAASVVVAAGGAMFLSNGARLGPIPAASEPARVVAERAQPPLLAPEKLAPSIRAGALNWRASGDRYELDLATALKPYTTNDFKAASAALERVASQYPRKPEPLLYLGICQLLMDRPVDAERTLRRAVALGGPDLDDARWYLAVAAYQNGKRSDARQLLASVCRENRGRAAEACLAHDQMGDAR